MAKFDIDDVTDGLLPSLSPNKENTAFNLDEYSLQIVLGCQVCSKEFDSPVFVSSDVETTQQRVIVCQDDANFPEENAENEDSSEE